VLILRTDGLEFLDMQELREQTIHGPKRHPL
jgi:hypothetical protein